MNLINFFFDLKLEMRKMLLDRMVNLLTRGCVVPVVKYIKQCCQKDDTDISLIRYFVTEVCFLYLIFEGNVLFIIFFF